MAALTTLQKAVIVLVSMGELEAVKVVKSLSNREIKQLSNATNTISKITPEEVMEVLEEFLTEVSGDTGMATSGEEWLKRVIEKAIGSNKAQHLLRGLGPQQKVFDSLFDVDFTTLSNLLRKEHPQTQALILAHLDPAKAAGVLPMLPEEEQVDIVLRMARVSSIHPDVISDIEDALMEEIQLMGTLTATEAGGIDMVVDMLNIMEKKSEKQILEGVEQEDPKLAEEIKAMMFVFEDMVSLDDRSMQMILREIDQQTLTLALRGANDEMRERIFVNVSSRAAQMLREDIDSMGPVKLSEVEQAQSEVVQVALRLEEEGKIAVSAGGDEEYV